MLRYSSDVRGETIWKTRVGLDMGCGEYPKQGEEVRPCRLELVNTYDQAPLQAIFQTVSEDQFSDIASPLETLITTGATALEGVMK